MSFPCDDDVVVLF